MQRNQDENSKYSYGLIETSLVTGRAFLESRWNFPGGRNPVPPVESKD